MQLRGLAGTDVTINAPLGVTVLTDEGEILGDLTTNNQTITVAQGTELLVAPILFYK
jgi:GTPase involved in cell partitioning and DNA repair